MVISTISTHPKFKISKNQKILKPLLSSPQPGAIGIESRTFDGAYSHLTAQQSFGSLDHVSGVVTGCNGEWPCSRLIAKKTRTSTKKRSEIVL